MKIGLIIQARINSTRLPRKMLLPLADKPIVHHVIERCLRVKGVDQVILACPVKDKELWETQSGFYVYEHSGPEWDLVGRFHGAIQKNELDVVCRVPADNPCVDPEIITKHLHDFLLKPTIFSSSQLYDYKGMCLDGLGAEICFANWYSYLDKYIMYPTFREHPHEYFKVSGAIDYPYTRHDAFVTECHVNTSGEYDRMKVAFENLYAHNHTFPGVAIGEPLRAANQAASKR